MFMTILIYNNFIESQIKKDPSGELGSDYL
jgi:hypothetical protein